MDGGRKDGWGACKTSMLQQWAGVWSGGQAAGLWGRSDSWLTSDKMWVPADGFVFVLLFVLFSQACWDFKIQNPANVFAFQSPKVLQSLFFVNVLWISFLACPSFPSSMLQRLQSSSLLLAWWNGSDSRFAGHSHSRHCGCLVSAIQRCWLAVSSLKERRGGWLKMDDTTKSWRSFAAIWWWQWRQKPKKKTYFRCFELKIAEEIALYNNSYLYMCIFTPKQHIHNILFKVPQMCCWWIKW